MSASREKKNRQELNESGYVDPKVLRAKETAAKESRFTRNIIIVICAFLLLGVALFAYNRIDASNTRAENAEISATPAVTINGTDYTVGDVSYFFYSSYNTFVSQNSAYLSVLGLDTSKSLHEQGMSDEMSWFDFFIDGAISSLTASAGIAAEAEAAGFNADERLDDEVEAALEIAELSAKQYGYSNRDIYLKAVYGPYVDEEVFSRNVRLSTYAQLYVNERNDALSFTDAELQEAYDADPKLYDSVEMEYVLFEPEITAEMTEEETAAKAEEAKANAEEILAKWAKDFEGGAEALGGIYNATEYARYTEEDEIAEWLFDDARKAGDRAVLSATETSYVAIEFFGRERNEYHPVTVRQILVEDEERANALLEEFRAGEQTEESFSVLAMLNSLDSTTSSNGGLIHGLYMGYADENYEEWCFDPARKSGDVTVLTTTSGAHVIYFVETLELPCWAAEAEAVLSSEDYQEWYATFNEDAVIEKLEGLVLVAE